MNDVAVLDMHVDFAAAAVDALDGGGAADLHALPHQPVLYVPAGLRLLGGQHPRRRLEDVDTGTEAQEGLPQLDTDGPGADHHDLVGQLPRQDRLTVGPDIDAFEAGDGGNHGRGPARDHDRLASVQLATVDGHLTGPVSLPSPRMRVWPASVKALAAPVSSSSRTIHIVRLWTLGVVDGEVHARGRQVARAPGLGQGLGAAEEGLAGHAAPVGALTADQVLLDHRQGKPGVLQLNADGLSGRAGADADDVKFLAH